jgi:ParB family chromosome partitioning protein
VTTKKRSFVPPVVHAPAQPEPGAGFKVARFPRAVVRSTSDSSFETPGASAPRDVSIVGLSEEALLGGEFETPTLIEIARICRSQFQNRKKIDPAYVADLAENLRTDKLNNPIIVRPLPGGLFELITGEHRVEAYRLNGETHIPGRVRDLDNKQAVRAVVLDNHFHRPPHDYERFVGYKMMLDEGAVSSRRSLASAVGFTHTQVNRLMAFGELPAEARAILDEHPDIIGAALAEALVAQSASPAGANAVVDALRKIAIGELTAARALSWVQTKLGSRLAKTSRVLTSAKGKPFCTLARDGLSIKIKVASGVDSAQLEDAVYEVLRGRAEAAGVVTESEG